MNKPVFKSTAKRPPLPSYTAEYPAGASIFEAGDLGTEMYIVHEGRVGIIAKVQGAEKQLAVLEKGDFFGEMALLEDQPRTAAARALTDLKLLQINGSTFDQMLRTNPEIAVRMMRKLSRRVRETDRLLQEALGHGDRSGELELPSADSTLDRQSGPQRMVHEKSGMEFFFSKGSETTVGRRDPVTGIHPDIDLTPVDNQRSISRRHAKLYKRGIKYFVAEDLGTMNGTFVNGERIDTGQPIEIRPGDEVRFGLVTLRFAGD